MPIDNEIRGSRGRGFEDSKERILKAGLEGQGPKSK
jgi:hypothetical protein